MDAAKQAEVLKWANRCEITALPEVAEILRSQLARIAELEAENTEHRTECEVLVAEAVRRGEEIFRLEAENASLRGRQPLTDENLSELWDESDIGPESGVFLKFARAIERAQDGYYLLMKTKIDWVTWKAARRTPSTARDAIRENPALNAAQGASNDKA